MAFDWVPREVVWYALRQKGVTEDLVDGVISLFKCCKTAVSVDGELSSSFSVKVDALQGSAWVHFNLSWLYFDRGCEG